ncbi:MAG: secondary thiamine-phosphate synthase enzyme YjbQ [Planctomycetota bacterium]|jgi:secondary thiamine-phosphate synthase enzyme
MTAEQLSVSTKSRTDLVDITAMVAAVVKKSGVKSGMCHVYVPHTTAGVTVNENADPAVPEDIATILDRVVPWTGGYAHSEGNSAAHVKSTMTGCTASIPIERGRMLLGTWQAVFFCEYDGPRSRKVLVKVIEG